MNDDNEVVEEASYQNPTAAEMTRRQDEINNMLGMRLRNDMNALEITVNDYSHDLKLVVDHFTAYLTGRTT